MPNKKETSAKVATKASEILKDNKTSSKSKSVAGSALSQSLKSPVKKQSNLWGGMCQHPVSVVKNPRIVLDQSV